MISTLFRKIRENEYRDVHGNLHCRIPLSKEVLNALLAKAEENVRAIRNIEVIDIREDILVLNIALGAGRIGLRDIDVVDRDLTLKVKRILGPPAFPLQLEIVKGTRRIENRIIEFLFKRKLDQSAVDLDNRKITFRHDDVFDTPAYQYMLSRLKRAVIEAKTDMIYFDLEFQFDP